MAEPQTRSEQTEARNGAGNERPLSSRLSDTFAQATLNNVRDANTSTSGRGAEAQAGLNPAEQLLKRRDVGNPFQTPIDRSGRTMHDEVVDSVVSRLTPEQQREYRRQHSQLQADVNRAAAESRATGQPTQVDLRGVPLAVQVNREVAAIEKAAYVEVLQGMSPERRRQTAQEMNLYKAQMDDYYEGRSSRQPSTPPMVQRFYDDVRARVRSR
jgi:hypothetical protein